tara:strand:+ start:50 stop:1126 length:1077 start_codon:yes stop_codon:yes gene_type:complete
MLDYNANLKSGIDSKAAFKMATDMAKKGESFLDGSSAPTILRYPNDALDGSQDMLAIKIFNNILNPTSATKITERKDAAGNNILDKDGKKIQDIQLTKLSTKQQEFNKEISGKKLQSGARYIYLPIPQQVTDSITVGYAEDTLNPIQAAGMALVKTGIKKPGEAAGQIIGLMKKLGTNISDQNLDNLQTVLAGQAINQLGANVNPQALITRSSGQILQSNLELLFSNATLRTFPFVFDFTPRSFEEGLVVKQIIRTIKRASVPKQGGAFFINSPDLFQFQYIAGNTTTDGTRNDNDHPFLNKFKVGVIENISVDYTASGTYATYDDKTPVHIRMSLTMKEINPIYAEDYDDEPSGVGF